MTTSGVRATPPATEDPAVDQTLPLTMAAMVAKSLVVGPEPRMNFQ